MKWLFTMIFAGLVMLGVANTSQAQWFGYYGSPGFWGNGWSHSYSYSYSYFYAFPVYSPALVQPYFIHPAGVANNSGLWAPGLKYLGFAEASPCVSPCLNWLADPCSHPVARMRDSDYPAVLVDKDFDLRNFEPGPTKKTPEKSQPGKMKLIPMQGRGEVEILLPTAEAEIWLDGALIKDTGKIRRFMTPPMAPGKTASVQIRARWLEGGETIQREYTVILKPNATMNLQVAK